MADPGESSGRVSITFILDPATGLVQSITPAGVTGESCQRLTAPYEHLFGGDKTDTKLPEFYQEEKVRQRAREGGYDGV